MSIEKHDDLFSGDAWKNQPEAWTNKPNARIDQPEAWTGRLDQMNALPGQEPLDKGLAWEKLYGRLREQPREKRQTLQQVCKSPEIRAGRQSAARGLPLYWLAAASFLCLAVLLGVIIKRRGGEMGVVQKQNVGSAPVRPGPDACRGAAHSAGIPERTPSIVSGPESPALNAGSPASYKPARNTHRLHPLTIRALHESVVMTDPEVRSLEITAILPPTLPGKGHGKGSGPSFVSPGMVKKSLAVVPVNEANFYNDPDSMVRQHPAQHSFKVRIYNPGRLDLPTLAQEEPANPLIKIKLSSQN